MIFKTSWREFFAFMGAWFIPSQTPIYIILDSMNYPIWLSYTISAVVSGIGVFCLVILLRGKEGIDKTKEVKI